MSIAEQTAILYYADFLSLKETSIPVTDNCKYFYIHGVPMNSVYILDMEPCFNEDSPYYKQSLAEYTIIKDKFGEEGINSFIEDICSIKQCGSVDAERMLKCIHQYSNKFERKNAIKAYREWKNSQKFAHVTINDDGELEEKPCTRYTYHVERMLGKPCMAKDV